MSVKGRDHLTGLPRSIELSTNEVVRAIGKELRTMVNAIKDVLQETPPELSSDVIDKGMVLTGGGANLRNIDRLLSQATGVPCYVADRPELCVAKGTGVALENLEAYKRSILAAR